MYLVISIENTLTIIPENWLQDINIVKQHYLNFGALAIKRTHTCFWTNKPSARNSDGSISHNYAPNFNATFHNEFPNEGCYFCKIIQARGNF